MQLAPITSSSIDFGFRRIFRRCFFPIFQTITTVSLLTFYSSTLMALFILMACCNPISGDLSSFLMARRHISASYGRLRTRTHTLCPPTRHNEHSSAALPLALPLPLSGCMWNATFFLIDPSWWRRRQAYPARPGLSAFWKDTQWGLCVSARHQSSVSSKPACGWVVIVTPPPPFPLPCALLLYAAKQLIKVFLKTK